MPNGNVTVVTYSDSAKRFQTSLFLCGIFKLVRLSGVPVPFLTVGALQDETISGVRVASVSLRLIQVTQGRICIAWGRDWRSRVLASREPSVNPSQ